MDAAVRRDRTPAKALSSRKSGDFFGSQTSVLPGCRGVFVVTAPGSCLHTLLDAVSFMDEKIVKRPGLTLSSTWLTFDG